MKLTSNQQIALEAIRDGRLYSIGRRYRQINTVGALINRGLVEFVEVNIGGQIGGKYALTEAGRDFLTPPRQLAWERAMGLRGYAGSPAAKADRAEGYRPDVTPES